MKGKNAQKSSARRTQVKDLPKMEKELSKAEQKKIKGGEPQALDAAAYKPKQ